jgi:uncharacterized protein (DUF736 family)
MIVRESEEIMSKFIIVGGGWQDTSRSGDPYIRIKLKSPVPENTVITMWKNKDKKTDRHPDFLIMAFVKEEEKPETPNDMF